jgi:hypothetical protein
LKKYIKIIIGVLALAIIGGWFYWQQHKKGIIKNTIENAISKGTDSLYFIRYDSSSIDEVNGNASFFNVDLQSDSLQAQLLNFDTASSATVYNIHIDEVSIRGANIPGLVNNTSVEAGTILIRHPVVYIISSGKKEKKILNSNDSLAIYEKLLGKFKNIRANEIIIENGHLFFSDKTGEPHTALKGISVQLKNFRIDSTRNYQNIISYFIKDIVAKVKEVNVQGENNRALFIDVEYSAPEKLVRIKHFHQQNKEGKIVFDVHNTIITGIATNAFILNQQLMAEELKSDGGMLTFYLKEKKKADTTKDEIEIENNYFDEALLNKVTIGNTKILIYNREKPDDEPLTINNVKFDAADIQKLHSGTNIRNLVSSSNWKLSADGFSFMSENRRYKISVGAFDINNVNSSVRIKNIDFIPQFTEAAFSKSIKYQDELYNLNFKNIELTGINTKLLITEYRLEAETATVKPDIKIFMDRTVTPNPASKVGKYPHQKIQNIKFPFSVKKVIIKNGMLAYTERSAETRQKGTVFFNNINGTITNATNITGLISKNNLMVLDATASFMGISKMHTVWKLPLNTRNGAFEVSGVAGGFDATKLNALIEPLSMASIKKGQVNKLIFEMTGTDLMTKGSATLLYDDLKIEVLKKDSNDLKKKGMMSIVANAFTKNQNPKNGVTRKDAINYERDITKSFFNLLWKSIFSAVKKTTQKL